MSKKIYFISDFHLGADALLSSREREKKIVKWLCEIENTVEELYLVGDVFDYWFEYEKVIPKGYTRLLGKLAEYRDKGIPVYFFTGNHDMWMFRYFEDELDIPIFRVPITRVLKGKTFFIGHGDGLGPNDYGYKFIKKIFSNKACQWLFARIHPNFGLWLMNFFSGKSRDAQDPEVEQQFLGEDKEWLVAYSNKKIDTLDWRVTVNAGSKLGEVDDVETQGGWAFGFQDDAIKTWYTSDHLNDMDIVRQHTLVRTAKSEVETIKVVTIEYSRGLFGTDHQIIEYGTRTKTFFLDDLEFSRRILAVPMYGEPTLGPGSFKIDDAFFREIYGTVNEHLDCDCYMQEGGTGKNRLKTGAPHR